MRAGTLIRDVQGDVLYNRRKAQGLTLREVSKRAGVALSYLSDLEHGKKEASSEVVASVTDALDMSVADLLRDIAKRLDTPGAS